MPAILTDLAPEIILALGLLAAFSSYLLARALIHIWQFTFQPILRGLEYILPGALKIFRVTVFPDLSGRVKHVESEIHRSLQLWLSYNEIAIAGVWHAMGAVQRWNAGIAEWLSKETVHGLEWLIHVRTPKITRAMIIAAFPAAFLSKLIADQIRKAFPHVSKYVHVIEHTITHTITHTIEKSAGAVLPGPLRLPGIWKEIRGFTKRLARIHWRLHRLEALLGVTGMAIAIARVLGVPNWRCLTRGNVGRTARHLCGLPAHVLDDLLGLLVDVLIIEDICQVVNLLSSGLQIIQVPIDKLVGAVGGSLCHGDYIAPPAMGPFVLSTAPVVGYTLS